MPDYLKFVPVKICKYKGLYNLCALLHLSLLEATRSAHYCAEGFLKYFPSIRYTTKVHIKCVLSTVQLVSLQ